MFKSRTFYCFFIVLLIFSFGVSGCSKPPAEEMAKADKAIDEAKQKEAPVYVPDLFAKAESSLKQAQEYIAGKKYKEAKQAAIETETNAQQAIAEIEAAKAKIKTEAERFAQDIQKEIDDLKNTISTAPKKKIPAKTIEEMQAEIAKWETDFTGIKEKLQGPKLKEASDELKNLGEQLNAKKEEITSILSNTLLPSPKETKK